jgi:hypothetical protein
MQRWQQQLHALDMRGRALYPLRAASLDWQSWGFGVTNLHLGIIPLIDQLLYFLPARTYFYVIGDCPASL